MSTIVYLQKSNKKEKKFMVTIFKPNGNKKIVHFGATGYSDFTIHKDPERMKRYDIRHKSRENWTKSGIDSPGFWSKWILWSAPSLDGAIKKTASKFNLTIKKSSPPTSSRKPSRKPSRK